MVKIVCIKEHRGFRLYKPGDELFVINSDAFDPTFWKVIEDSTPYDEKQKNLFDDIGNTETDTLPQQTETETETETEPNTETETQTEPETEPQTEPETEPTQAAPVKNTRAKK